MYILFPPKAALLAAQSSMAHWAGPCLCQVRKLLLFPFKHPNSLCIPKLTTMFLSLIELSVMKVQWKELSKKISSSFFRWAFRIGEGLKYYIWKIYNFWVLLTDEYWWLEKIVHIQKMKSNMTSCKPLSVPPTAWLRVLPQLLWLFMSLLLSLLHSWTEVIARLVLAPSCIHQRPTIWAYAKLIKV